MVETARGHNGATGAEAKPYRFPALTVIAPNNGDFPDLRLIAAQTVQDRGFAVEIETVGNGDGGPDTTRVFAPFETEAVLWRVLSDDRFRTLHPNGGSTEEFVTVARGRVGEILDQLPSDPSLVVNQYLEFQAR